MKEITLQQMIEAGAHYGHRTNKWDPKMKPYIFGEKEGIHVIDLRHTFELYKNACEAIKSIVAAGGKVLFVGTKKQAQNSITESAQKALMPYVSYRWLGGMLTNFKTIRSSIDKLKKYEKMIETNQLQKFSKKEIMQMSKEIQKLDRNLGGLRNMTKAPKALFIVDVRREHLAIEDAKKLGIPIIAIVDTNANPTLVDYPIPANDDAIRSIKLFTDGIAEACIEGNALYEETLRTEENDDTKVEKKRSAFKPKKPIGKKPFKKSDDVRKSDDEETEE